MKKRLVQSANLDSLNFQKKEAKRQKIEQAEAMAAAAHREEILSREPEPHPFAPRIPLYLRPATENDAQHIANIYNHYVVNSIVPEDHEPLETKDILSTMRTLRSEQIPFIVAVRGRLPQQSQSSRHVNLPQFENIVGFAFGEHRNYGLKGLATGRSRFSANLHLYVHHENTRQGIGRCLLDRLLQIMSYSYAGKDGYDWINHTNDPSYEIGRGGRCYEAFFQLPIIAEQEKTKDPNYEWIKAFLGKFYFVESARILCDGRSNNISGNGKWLDVVHFQLETTNTKDIEPFA